MRRKDEAKFGEYRTKRVILGIYDALSTAIRTGQPYQTLLAPPPGPPVDMEGTFLAMTQWDRVKWPPNIHLPKQEAAEQPQELPLAEFAAMAYPATDTDKAICAAALAIVEQSSGLSSADHLDAVLLVTHPDWCRIFLDQNERLVFDAVQKSVLKSLFLDAEQSIRWKDSRDYLEQKRAISVNHKDKNQAMILGTTFSTVQKGLPNGMGEIVRFALTALRRIGELRKDLPSIPREQARIIEVFKEQHRLYQLAA